MTIHIASTVGQLTLTAAQNDKGVLQLTAHSSKRVKIKEIGISFNGVDTTLTPVLVKFARASGASGGTAVTPVENELALESPLASALRGTFATDPTVGDIQGAWYVSPAAGMLVIQYPLGDEPVVAPSASIALFASTGTAVAPTVSAYIKFEE